MIDKKGRLLLLSGMIVNDKKEILLLYRKDHNHFETPGGKLELSDCKYPEKITIDDFIMAVKREVTEELGNIVIEEPKLALSAEFEIPDGRPAIVYKFLTKIISGKPEIQETKLFSRLEWIPIKKIKEFPVAPDLKILADKLQDI